MKPGSMKISELKVGDRIRIIGIPGDGIPDYVILPETKRVYKRLIARGRSVRIARFDEYGQPWYDVRFLVRGRWEVHTLAVFRSDKNWVLVKPQRKKKRPL
jgi:hypothetical protein